MKSKILDNIYCIIYNIFIIELVERSWFAKGGEVPRYFYKMMNKKELSIFIDESGDFGEYRKYSPYYLVSMVFHNQNVDISDNIKKLDDNLRLLGLTNLEVHSAPIIRQEENYENMDRKIRRSIFNKFFAFIKHIDIKYKVFVVKKKEVDSPTDLSGKLAKSISSFIRENYEYLESFDVIKVYYDNGQNELSKILSSVFNSFLDNVEFKKVVPYDYKLFQVADFICTLKLVSLGIDNSNVPSSVRYVLGNDRDIKKNYLKIIINKRI